MNTRSILSRSFLCSQKSTYQSGSGQRPYDDVLESLEVGCLQWILYAWWIVGWIGVVFHRWKTNEHSRLNVVFLKLSLKNVERPNAALMGEAVAVE